MGKFLEMKTTEDGWEYVTRVNCSGVVIVLVYHTGKEMYLMVEQYRPPIGCRVLEWPAGLIDDGETAVQAAMRELFEETGLTVSEENLINLGRVYSAVGITNEEVNVFAVEIDDSFELSEPDIKGKEIENSLVRKWVTKDELMLSKAAKVLTVYARYHAKKANPKIVFPI